MLYVRVTIPDTGVVVVAVMVYVPDPKHSAAEAETVGIGSLAT
jgi:uncharacterized OB-fold protein